LKDYEENFNWAKISAMLSPSFYRRLIFRDRELMLPKNIREGYGYSLELSDFEDGDKMMAIKDASSVRKFKERIFDVSDKK
jgi:hypothetical protein